MGRWQRWLARCWLVALLGAASGKDGHGPLPLPGASTQLSLRPTDVIVGGVLVRDGRQTSCNVVPVGQAAVFVAASCLDLDDKKQLRSTTDKVALQVYGRTEPQWQLLDPAHVRVHAGYDPASQANNVAIVRLDTQWTPTVSTSIALAGAAQSAVTYRHALLDGALRRWTTLAVRAAESSQAECLASSLFRQNPGALTCSGMEIESLKVNDTEYRGIGYGTAATGEGTKMSTLALYSHSQTTTASGGSGGSGSGSSGSGLARRGAGVLHYYTAVGNYARFASDFLGASVTITDAGSGAALVNQTLTVNPVPADPGVVVLGGNELTPSNAVGSADAPSTAAAAAAAVTSEATSVVASDSHPASGDSAGANRRGLTAGAILGIAIAAVVVAVAVSAVATRYALMARRKRRAEAYWDHEIAKMQSARSLAPMSPVSTVSPVDP